MRKRTARTKTRFVFSYLEHLEERSLSGVAASGAGGHHNVDGCEGADTGGGGHAVGLDHVADVAELAVGEDEAHVSHDLGEELRRRARQGERGQMTKENTMIKRRTKICAQYCVKGTGSPTWDDMKHYLLCIYVTTG